MFRRFKIRPGHVGLYFYDDVFTDVLMPGRHWHFDPLGRARVKTVSTVDVTFTHDRLKEIVSTGALQDRAITLDLDDSQRALVWVDGRFHRVLGPGLHALWTLARHVRYEIVDACAIAFQHKQLATISRSESGARMLEIIDISRDHAGVLFQDGRFIDVLQPSRYAFWRGVADTRVIEVDLREKMLDITGQDLMTADNVTLRLNAVVAYRIVDARRAVSSSERFDQSLYRESQLVLRHAIGSRDLDSLLTSKDDVAGEAMVELNQRAHEFGVQVVSVGLRDVILPGEMKELLNQVTQAKKAAEANLISRREETAAMRSQANTAKLLEASPMLMRLRELEVLEKVASNSSLQVLMGSGEGLTDRIAKMI
jgi:regulator of protease activity HflC (stomatin/prohibitin superfamily)